MIRFKVERSRWAGAILQPLLFWAMLGYGMGGNFRAGGATPTASLLLNPDGTGAVVNDTYVNYFFPGSLVMVVLFTAMFASMSIIEDRNSGFLQGVLVIPGARAGALLGKVASVTTLSLGQVALFLLASPLAGFNALDFAFGSLVYSLVAGTVGLAALSLAGAWLINSTHGYHAVMMVILFPLWIVSGAMFPMQGEWQAIFAWVNPLSYFVEGVRLSLRGESLLAPAHAAVSIGLAAVVVVTLSAAFLSMRRTGVQAV